MDKTAVMFSPIYYQHNSGRNHPESARRLNAIISELKRGQLSGSRNWQFVEPEKASIEHIKLIHDIGYIRFIETFCRSGGGLIDSEDTMVSRKSFEVALYAAGGTLKVVNLVMKGKFKNAFAAVRPPGHHAERFRAFGFCIFNNVAIAAKYLLKNFGLKRIAILDIDAHHGNGTQESFYQTDQVLYVSLHQDPTIFPRTGFIDEIGEGEGLGFNVNIPLPFWTSDRVYLKALREIVVPITREYKPQFLLVSAGLDGHYTDPVGNLSLSVLCYQEIFETIVNLASEMCHGKLASVLEGGYSPKFVGKIAAVAIAKMSKTFYSIKDKAPPTSKNRERKGEKIIREVKKVQSSFWRLS